jgi:hypothetical protein
MITINDVTLIAISGIGHKAEENVKALTISQNEIAFGSVKYIQLGHIKDIDSWNKAVIYDLPTYVDTTHAFLVHGDGYVKNPALWNPEWLNYDYIGAPWPLPIDSYSYRDEEDNLIRMGNSVSLRSKKLMDLVATREWRSYFGNTNEDGFICCHNRKWLESHGCKFAPLEVAIHFSKENEIPENRGLDTFAFHSL